MNSWPPLYKIDPQGIFDVTYEFTEPLTAKQQETIGGWLSNHCTHNFIFIKITNQIIAGGYGNNSVAWANRQLKSMSIHHQKIHKWEIRMVDQDATIFEMVWGNLLSLD
jgi:hypothetical protein